MWLKIESGEVINCEQVGLFRIEGTDLWAHAGPTSLLVRQFKQLVGARRAMHHLCQHLADPESSIVNAMYLRGDVVEEPA